MRTYLHVPMALALAATAWGQAPIQTIPNHDPLLDALIQEAMARSPDLAQATALGAAEREKIPQAGALPDPTLTVGIQNDGFKKIQVGKMETSYYQLTLTQPFPWPGKRDLRADVARLGAEAAEAGLGRNRLSLKADVQRTYGALLLARDQVRLLATQETLLDRAEALAKARYEVGQGSQMDLLRAQLGHTRLAQTRLALEAEERSALATLNRLRALPPETALPTPATFGQIPDPAPIHPEEALEAALRESPEVKAAQVQVTQAERSLDLARLDRKPDFAVSAGLMPRGGLDPMWSLGVGVSLPVWSRSWRQHAVAEQELRRQAQGFEAAGLGHVLKARIHERAAQLDSALAMLRLYRGGLLVQSQVAFQASLAQYEAGKVSLTAVLDALNDWIADQSGLLQVQAQAQAIAIAQEELSLGPVVPIGATGLAAATLGGAASSVPMTAAKAPTSRGASSASNPSPMPSM